MTPASPDCAQAEAEPVPAARTPASRNERVGRRTGRRPNGSKGGRQAESVARPACLGARPAGGERIRPRRALR